MKVSKFCQSVFDISADMRSPVYLAKLHIFYTGTKFDFVHCGNYFNNNMGNLGVLNFRAQRFVNKLNARLNNAPTL